MMCERGRVECCRVVVIREDRRDLCGSRGRVLRFRWVLYPRLHHSTGLPGAPLATYSLHVLFFALGALFRIPRAPYRMMRCTMQATGRCTMLDARWPRVGAPRSLRRPLRVQPLEQVVRRQEEGKIGSDVHEPADEACK